MTIKEIAEIAGVSIGTVDRALHDRGRVSEKTKKKILDIIKETGYTQNVVASQLSRSKDTVFNVILPELHQNGYFWQFIKDGIDTEAASLNFIKLTINYHHYDRYNPETLLAIADKLEKTPGDGMLLAPVVLSESSEFVSRLSEKVPFCLVNAELPASKNCWFIGQNSLNSGRTAAQLMEKQVPAEASLAVLEIEPEDFHINQRAKGFKEYFAGNKNVSICRYPFPHDFQEKEFDDLIQQIRKNQPKLDGLFVPNSSIHYLIKQLSTLYPKKIPVTIGYDLIDQNVKMLKEGRIDFLITQNPQRQGRAGIRSLFRRVLMNEKEGLERTLPIEIVISGNVDSYLNDLPG